MLSGLFAASPPLLELKLPIECFELFAATFWSYSNTTLSDSTCALQLRINNALYKYGISRYKFIIAAHYCLIRRDLF